MMLLPMIASADAVEINGIYYNLIDKAKQAEVTRNPNKYKGNVVIPETILYEGNTYKVTSIGNYAFQGSVELTSFTISDNVTSIGELAFPTGIKSISIDSGNAFIFDMQGNWIDNVRKGVNIIRTRDGKTRKIVAK